MRRRAPFVLPLAFLALWASRPLGVAALPTPPDLVTLSIVGTTDLHGYTFPQNGRGGLSLLAGYVNNLRATRAAGGGAVLLIDSGDTFQGGIESNLSEGAIVVDAYNAIGYTAAAIGNHDFEFGPVDALGVRQQPRADPRGAIKARAAQSHFPFLAANLIDDATGRPVDWPNVHPSVLVDAAGIKVGVIGVMTIDALRATLPVNVLGLHVSPLAPAIAAEARKLRAAGAHVVVVGAHAGGSCTGFADPVDASTCDPTSEIFEVARNLPRGLVDVIAAGHTHDGVAHEVEGIAVVEAYALGRWFGRVDVVVDRRAGRVVHREIFAPRELCAQQDADSLSCDPRDGASPPLPVAQYEGRAVISDSAVADAMIPAMARVRQLQAASLGVVLETPVRRVGDPESPLGNLFADALRERSEGADLALINNSRGGLRSDLPEGMLTFGRLYDVFPFDNRLVRLTLSGAELRRVFADEVRRNRRGALGISGLRVRAGCAGGRLEIDLFRPGGQPVGPEERLVVVAMDSLVSGVVFASAILPGGLPVQPDAPVVREVVEDWLRQITGRLSANQFAVRDHRRWEYVDQVPVGCTAD